MRVWVNGGTAFIRRALHNPKVIASYILIFYPTLQKVLLDVEMKVNYYLRHICPQGTGYLKNSFIHSRQKWLEKTYSAVAKKKKYFQNKIFCQIWRCDLASQHLKLRQVLMNLDMLLSGSYECDYANEWNKIFQLYHH